MILKGLVKDWRLVSMMFYGDCATPMYPSHNTTASSYDRSWVNRVEFFPKDLSKAKNEASLSKIREESHGVFFLMCIGGEYLTLILQILS